MIKVKNYELQILSDLVTGAPIEADSYKLKGGIFVIWNYQSESWEDEAGNKYTPVTIGSIVGFNKIDSLNNADKELLRSGSAEDKAYLEYNELLGGDRIAIEEPKSYPHRLAELLEAGETIESIYRECIEKRISWEELLRCVIDDDTIMEIFL